MSKGELTSLRPEHTQAHGDEKTEALQIRLISDLNALQSLRPAWEGLLARIPTASIFSTWEWLGPWWRAYGGERELLVLAFHAPDGELAGLAPLSRVVRRVAPGLRLRVLEFMGDGSEDSDNLDILALPGYERAVTAGLLNYFREHDSAWDVAQFNLFPSHSTAAVELQKQLRTLNWTAFRYTHPWCVLHLPDTWDAYLKQLSRKERDNIRYYQRRLTRRCQTRFYKCTTTAELPHCLQSLFRLHQLRWTLRGEPGSFAWDARRQFYEELSHELLRRNWLEFWLLDIDGKPAVAQYSFRYRETVYALQQGFDVQYAQLCVQDVLRAHVLQQVIPEGVRRYDFLGGVNPRKERWGGDVGHYLHLHFARPRGRGSFYLHAVRNARTSKDWARQHLPAPVLALIRRLKRQNGSLPGQAQPLPKQAGENQQEDGD